jgi:hypothetical protein
MSKGQTDSPVMSDADFIRQFAVTEEGKPKYSNVETAPNVVFLGEYRRRRLAEARPPSA